MFLESEVFSFCTTLTRLDEKIGECKVSFTNPFLTVQAFFQFLQADLLIVTF